MLLILRMLLGRANDIRCATKLALSLLIWDLFALIITLTLIVWVTESNMNIWIAVVGLIWMALTAGAIWHFGGVWVDAGFSAHIFGADIGKDFTNALVFFFLVQAAIISFLFFMPVYKYWPGYFAFLVILTGLFLSGTLGKIPMDWNSSWRIFAVMAGLIIAMMLIAWFSGEVPKLNVFSKDAPFWPRVAVFGTIILILATLFSRIIPFSRFFQVAGFLMLFATIVVWAFPETRSAYAKICAEPKATKEKKQQLKREYLEFGLDPGEYVMIKKCSGITPPALKFDYANGQTGNLGAGFWNTHGTRYKLTNDEGLKINKVYLTKGQRSDYRFTPYHADGTLKYPDNKNLNGGHDNLAALNQNAPSEKCALSSF